LARLWSSAAAPLLRFPMIEPPAAASPRLVWSVSALLQATGDAVAARFGALAVRGELSGFARAPSGHCYFALKDGEGGAALIRCAMFRRASALVDFKPADGQQVEVRGRIGVYEPRGELQLVVESLRRVGAGALYEEFLRLRARLQAQGLFDDGRKRAIERRPRRIGVVTSLGAAALHDVLTAMARRSPQVEVIIYPSLVQGPEAPAALVAALALANARNEVQTLLLVRGGGSLEDLWAFNDERVVRAVAASRIPLVCGVGHETDVTLADLAADLRAPTPTAAAELAAPALEELLGALQQRATALGRQATRALERETQRLDRLALHLGRPARQLAAQAERLEAAASRLDRALVARAGALAEQPRRLGQRLLQAGAAQRHRLALRLAAADQGLAALDPRQVLRRGYAWVEAADGRPVLSARALKPGDAISAVWADGRAQAEVLRVDPAADPAAEPAP
jgi:exodeoxyribonuclease VII large subunit